MELEERTPLGNGGQRVNSALTGYRETLRLDDGLIVKESGEICCVMPEKQALLVPVFAGVINPTAGGVRECLECSVCREIGLFFKASCSRIFRFPDAEAFKGVDPITFKEFNLWRVGTKRWPCTECEDSCMAMANQMVEAIGTVALDKVVESLRLRKGLGGISTA